ncbi:hypothetical protein [Arthrobacter sp. S39]|uniref:hypothetical protein n=1 Tax=Arthrobacter sp. S39 TaxID=2509720 RepID=UPI0010378D4E|nr:hypothetical protein [Arthrobacter sp. S39]TAP39565.1 hypothetical protein EYS21_21585 [Arthrobacter sp. S39]
MTTTSFDLTLTHSTSPFQPPSNPPTGRAQTTATRRGAGKDAFAHLSRDESLAMIPPLILELSGRISRRAALLEASWIDPTQGSNDLAALAWILQSLEDVEATVIGLSEANRRRSAAIKSPDPSSAGRLIP